MTPQLSIPTDSNFDLNRSIELLALTDKAQNIHAQFKQQLPNDWERWHNWEHDLGPMPISVPGFGDYDVYLMLERAEFTWGRRKVVPFGFVAKKQNTLYVVFRGTATRAEWFSNIRGFHRAYSPVSDSGEAHRGFHAVYTRPNRGHWWANLFDGKLNFNKRNDKPSMGQMIKNFLTDEDTLNEIGVDADTQLFVTGHSLGGALATLAALHISKATQFTAPILYAFANPRAGDGNFADACADLEAYRIFNSEDLVPVLPFSTIKTKADKADDSQSGNRIDRVAVEKEFKVLRMLPVQSYAHVGEAIAFTDPLGTIPANHVIASYLEFLSGNGASVVNDEGAGDSASNPGISELEPASV